MLDIDSINTAFSNGAPIALNNIADTHPNIGLTLLRQANYTGGTPGWVNGGMFLHNTVASTPTAYEWTLTSVMDNSAAIGENVGAYFQGLKRSTGATWASVSEVADMTYAASTPTSGGLIAIEVDVFANGTDGYDQRVGVDIVVGNARLAKTGTLGETAQIGNAIRIAPQDFNESLAYAKVGLNILTSSVAGILNQATGTYGIKHTGDYVTGIDLSEATHADSAIRLHEDDCIKLGADVSFKYNSYNQCIEFLGKGGARKGYLNVSEAAPDGPILPAASSFVTLETTQTITGVKLFDRTIYTRQDISCRNAILGPGTVCWASPGNTSLAAKGGAARIPSQAAGFLRIEIDGTSYKVPFFGA